jgi:uncharacterized protein YegJ (DUF2314 family)
MYTLINAKEMNAKHPDTFEIPSDERIKALTLGEYVKLGFEEMDDGELFPERMWVEVTKIDGDKFEGNLGNEPVFIESLRYRDKVVFESKHIMATLD